MTQAARRYADWANVSRRIAPILIAASGLFLSGCATVSVSDPLATPQRPLPLRISGIPWERDSVLRQPIPRREGLSSRAVPSAEPAVTVRQLESAPTPVREPDMVALGFASITAQAGSDPAQRRLQAARAAKLDAYRNLAEQLYGVEFASDSVIADSRVREDHIRTRISGVISGAEIVSLEPLGNDSYQATVRLPGQQVVALRRRSP